MQLASYLIFSLLFLALMVLSCAHPMVGDPLVIDPSGLMSLLSSFGPWGVLAGAGLMLFLAWRNKRNPSPTPAPGPGPSPIVPDPSPIVPGPAPTGRPVLDFVMKLLADLAASRFPKMSREAALERYLVDAVQTETLVAEMRQARQEREQRGE